MLKEALREVYSLCLFSIILFHSLLREGLIMKSIYLILYCLFMAGCSVHHTNSENSVQTISHPGDYTITNFIDGNNYIAHILKNPEFINLESGTDCWEDDSFRFFLIDKRGNQIVDYSFCSSYGEFTIDFVDLNGDKKMEIIFILGEGRGTSARRVILTLYEVVRSGLQKCYSCTCSDYYGSGCRWWYDRHYKDTDGDGITDLELILSYNPIGETPLQSPELIPKAKRILYNGVKEKAVVQ